MKKSGHRLIIEKHLVDLDVGSYVLIVPDNASGRENRYTVYRIPPSTGRYIRVIGRELPLGFAKKIVQTAGRRVCR